ncbi:MAG: DUF3793 family protein [Thermoplasmatales archaeon]|nr:DUF3793 family protein [Thermoplasmatales archaeon]
MLEKKIVEHCSPTLAGLKCGSLFRHDTVEDMEAVAESVRAEIGRKGIEIAVLGKPRGGYLVYVHRPAMLEELISDGDTNDFLRRLGYESMTVDGIIDELRGRVSSRGALPHEIGVFLGYPLGDVKGFMRNRGKNSVRVGCWKVYGDEDAAVRSFEKYRKCRRVFKKRYAEGASIRRLAVRCHPTA